MFPCDFVEGSGESPFRYQKELYFYLKLFFVITKFHVFLQEIGYCVLYYVGVLRNEVNLNSMLHFFLRQSAAVDFF